MKPAGDNNDQGFASKQAQKKRAEAERLAQEDLKTGETLSYSDKEGSLGFLGVILFIPGIVFILAGINYYLESLNDTYGSYENAGLSAVIFICVGLLCAWPAYYSVFFKTKNLYFVTDKRVHSKPG